MRAATASRILWWIVGILGVFALIQFISGDAGAGDAFRTFVAIGLTVGGLSWLGYHYRVLPRRESFEGQARELGLRAQRGDPLGLLGRPFVLFRWASSVRDLENTATGPRGGLDVVVADYWFTPSSDPQLDDYLRYTCVLTRTRAGWSDLSVVPERLASKVRDLLAMPDIGTESAEFDRRFEIRSPDRRFASAFVDVRLMAWLLEQPPGIGFEILDGWLMVFRPRVTTSVDDLPRALELFDGLMGRIPRVVFPSRPDAAGPPA
jgi:hypothetical protein